jgi:DNA polymerase-3 subunit alpha
MGKKKASEMKAQREKFLNGAKDNEIDEKLAEDIFNTMEKFAEYSFNKSHSTAYAYITFQTAYLKTYYPCEFMASLMTTEINNSEKIVSDIRECKEMNINILPPSINESGSGFTPLKNSIRFGLNAVKNLGTNIVKNIINLRDEQGEFKNIFEFLGLMDSRRMNKKTLESLIKSGTLDEFGLTRSTLFENIDKLQSHVGINNKDADKLQESLFDNDQIYQKPELQIKQEWDIFDLSKFEIETLGYSISVNPLNAVHEKIQQINSKSISEIKSLKDKTPVTTAVYITSIEIKSSKKNANKYANVSFEDSSGVLEGIIFNDEIIKHESKLELGVPLLISGFVENSDDVIKLIVNGVNGNEAIKEIKNISLPLKIQISRDISLDDTMKLKTIFEKFPGNSNVEINLSNNGLKAKISIEGCKVENCDELKEQIQNLNFSSH